MRLEDIGKYAGANLKGGAQVGLSVGFIRVPVRPTHRCGVLADATQSPAKRDRRPAVSVKQKIAVTS